jgi:hypothetical protein
MGRGERNRDHQAFVASPPRERLTRPLAEMGFQTPPAQGLTTPLGQQPPAAPEGRLTAPLSQTPQASPRPRPLAPGEVQVIVSDTQHAVLREAYAYFGMDAGQGMLAGELHYMTGPVLTLGEQQRLEAAYALRELEISPISPADATRRAHARALYDRLRR